jgi:type I restriction enzyme R subunit
MWSSSAPRGLTRAELKALRFALDGQGYSENKSAPRLARTKNENISALIIGFVRQAALRRDALPPA